MGEKVLTGKPRIKRLLELIRQIEIGIAAPHDSCKADSYQMLGTEDKAVARIILPVLSQILGDLHSKLEGKHELIDRQIEDEMYNAWRSVMERYILDTDQAIVLRDDAIIRNHPLFEEFRYDRNNERKSAVGLAAFSCAAESLGIILEGFNHLVREEKRGGRGRGGDSNKPHGNDD